MLKQCQIWSFSNRYFENTRTAAQHLQFSQGLVRPLPKAASFALVKSLHGPWWWAAPKTSLLPPSDSISCCTLRTFLMDVDSQVQVSGDDAGGEGNEGGGARGGGSGCVGSSVVVVALNPTVAHPSLGFTTSHESDFFCPTQFGTLLKVAQALLTSPTM